MEKTKTLLLLLTSSIILFKLYLFPPTQSHEDLKAEPDELELTNLNNNHTWPLLYAKDVVSLNGKNFSEFMGKNRNVMVMFYANWCYWSKKLAPEFAAAAKMLKGEADLVMVDAYLEKDLAKEYNILAYPTLYLFVAGVRQFQFFGERTRWVLFSPSIEAKFVICKIQ